MSLFPLFVKLHGRLVVVIGGGNIAQAKIPGLLAAGARVRVIAPDVLEEISSAALQGSLEWRPKLFAVDDLDGAHLVIAATSSSEVNKSVFRASESRGLWCNAVDDPQHCHFYYGAVVQRGDLQIAISTNGKSPALAQRLRQELESQFGPDYAPWLEWLGVTRDLLRAENGDAHSGKALLHHLASRPQFENFLRGTRRASEQGAA